MFWPALSNSTSANGGVGQVLCTPSFAFTYTSDNCVNNSVAMRFFLLACMQSSTAPAGMQTALAIIGLLALPVVGWSEFQLNATGKLC